jgi:hypothetical protein
LIYVNRAPPHAAKKNRCVLALKRANAQSWHCALAILVKNHGGFPMMFVNARCNNAGPLSKLIPTRSFAAFLFARINVPITRLRW